MKNLQAKNYHTPKFEILKCEYDVVLLSGFVDGDLINEDIRW